MSSNAPADVAGTTKPRKLNTHRLFVTWAGLTHLEVADRPRWRQDLRDICRGTNLLVEYSICVERHSQPTDPEREWHVHAYLKYRNKVQAADRTTTKIFDVVRDGRRLKPYILSVGPTNVDRTKVVRYTEKEDEEVDQSLEHALTPLPGEEGGVEKEKELSYGEMLNECEVRLKFARMLFT